MEKSNKGIMFLIIGMLGILLVVILGLGAYLMLVVLPGFSSDAPPPIQAATGLSPAEIYPINLESQQYNLSLGADGKAHLLVAEFCIEVDNTHEKESAAFIELTQNHMVRFRDAAIRICLQTSIETLRAPGGLDELTDELKRAFNETFSTNLVYNVLVGKYNFQ